MRPLCIPITRNDHSAAAPSSAAARARHLRAGQARLFETLLPRLAIDLQSSAPASLADAVSARRPTKSASRSALAAPSIWSRRPRRNPARGFIGVEPFVNGMAKALAAIEAKGLRNIRLHHGDATDLLAWLPARFARARRSALSRSVAEAAALEAPLRAGSQRRGDRARPETRRRIPLRHRYSRLHRLDAGAAAALDRISTGPRSAPTTGASPGRISSARATRPRPCAKAARPAI